MGSNAEQRTDTNRKRFKVPSGFDPAVHGEKFLRKIEDRFGTGFRIESFDPGAQELMVVRESAVAEFVDDGESIHVGLPDGTQESQGPKVAKQYEALKPGWRITDFRPYAKPGYATMRQMTEQEVRVRDAIATVLRVARTPWKVQVREDSDGGFALQLPESYSPAAHDQKLQEVAETSAGSPGWFIQIDPKSLRGQIIPGELPTFPSAVPAPLDRSVPGFTDASDTPWYKVPLGTALGVPGEPQGPEFSVDLKAAGHILMQGTPGSGKTVTINAFIWWAVNCGAKLAITDTPDKSVDFMWARDYCMDGGWGCETYPEMVATSQLVYDEGKRRAQVLRQKGVANWFEVADKDPSFAPLIYVIDEFTVLTTKKPEPKSLDEDHPKRVAIAMENSYKDLLSVNIQQIILEMRFAGIFVLLATQVGNTTTGITTAMKIGCGNRILMGSRPSDRQRANAFSDPDSVPAVPPHITGAEEVSKGVGAGEFEGQHPTVFKGYYATAAQFKASLDAKPSLARTSRPQPTQEEISRALSEDDDLDEDDRAFGATSTNPFGDEGPRRGRPTTSAGMNAARELGLTGAAAANYAGKYDMREAGRDG